MQISDVQVSFDGDSTELEDIARCVRNIILTPAGTCPLYRDFGISYDSVSHPVQVAMNEVALEIMEKIEKYEPRVESCKVSFEGRSRRDERQPESKGGVFSCLIPCNPFSTSRRSRSSTTTRSMR